MPKLRRGREAGELSPAARGRQGGCLVLETRFPLGLITARETSSRDCSQRGAGKKAQFNKERKGALIYLVRFVF